MRVLRRSALVLVAFLGGAVGASRASADESGADPAIAMSMSEAWDELVEEEQALAGGDCVTMCKALHSMAHAAQRICALAEGGGEADRQRCAEAKKRVEEATKRVLAACPGCNPSPPYAPATVPPPPTVDAEDKGAKTKPSMDEPTALAGSSMEEVSIGRRTPRLTLALVPSALFLPPAIFKLSADVRVVDHFSVAVSGGLGRVATTGGDGHATAYTLGAQLRGYLFAPFSGLYLAADLRWAHASLEDAERVSSRAIVPGLTIGPMLGFKLVAFGGFTLDTSVGLGVVAVDRRREGDPTSKLVPTWDLGVGYSF